MGTVDQRGNFSERVGHLLAAGFLVTGVLATGVLGGAVMGSGQAASAVATHTAVATQSADAFHTGPAKKTPPPPPPQNPVSSVLNAVSCTSTTSCMAVGYFQSETGVYRTLTEKLTGSTWSIVTSPNATTVDDQLNGVSCMSASDCVAVGNTNNEGDNTGAAQTVAELWNGTSWSVMTTPDVGTGDNLLNAVACTSATSCVAVGGLSNSATLVESWDGVSWSVVSSPTPTGDGGYLASVSCTSSTSCMAVGSSATGQDYNTLAESWDGTDWSIEASPDGGVWSFLGGVSCTSSTSCVAVGNYSAAYGGNTAMLTEFWDGTSWTVGPGFGNGVTLTAVTCTGATSCVAVGVWDDGTSDVTIYLLWNGKVWSATSNSPNPTGSKYTAFAGVACPGVTSCVGVGSWQDDADLYHNLIENFGGSSWSLVTSPDEVPPPAPTITTFKPKAKPVGKKVTIVGTNLAGAQVTFNGTAATLVSDTATKITTTVPTGATTGTIQVMTAGGVATSSTAFKVKTSK